MISVGFLERTERRFAGTVARGNVFHFEGVMQRGDSLLDILVVRNNQMESARDEMNTRIDRGRGLHNPVDAEMRAANDEHDTFRRIDGQRQLACELIYRQQSVTSQLPFASSTKSR